MYLFILFLLGWRFEKHENVVQNMVDRLWAASVCSDLHQCHHRLVIYNSEPSSHLYLFINYYNTFFFHLILLLFVILHDVSNGGLHDILSFHKFKQFSSNGSIILRDIDWLVGNPIYIIRSVFGLMKRKFKISSFINFTTIIIIFLL